MIFSGIADEAGRPIEVQIEAHKDLGWNNIELRMIGDKNLTDVSDAEFERVLGLVNDADMKISCFASQLGNWSRDITGEFDVDEAELARAIPRMQRADTKFIRTMSWKQSNATSEEWCDEAIRRMSELAQMAADGDIVIAHENCTGWASEGPENTIELVEKVASPALAVLYDTGNSVGYSKDTMGFLHGVIDRIAYVHIKDMVREADGTSHGVFPGEGESFLKRQLIEILQSGYDGVFSIEPHVAAVIHEGKAGDDPEALYDSYIKYGKMAMAMFDEIKTAT